MKSVTYQIPISWQNEKPCLHRMIRQERCRVMNEHGAEPVYKNPIAVYVLEFILGKSTHGKNLRPIISILTRLSKHINRWNTLTPKLHS